MSVTSEYLVFGMHCAHCATQSPRVSSVSGVKRRQLDLDSGQLWGSRHEITFEHIQAAVDEQVPRRGRLRETVERSLPNHEPPAKWSPSSPCWRMSSAYRSEGHAVAGAAGASADRTTPRWSAIRSGGYSLRAVSLPRSLRDVGFRFAVTAPGAGISGVDHDAEQCIDRLRRTTGTSTYGAAGRGTLWGSQLTTGPCRHIHFQSSARSGDRPCHRLHSRGDYRRRASASC